MKEIIHLLEKVRKECWTDEGFPWPTVETKKILPSLDQALTLLKQPKCKTCVDTGTKVVHNEYGAVIHQASGPCPDCQQPSAGEHPTIENTEVCPCGNIFFEADDYDTIGSQSGICCPACGNEKFQTVKDRLDRLEAINAELLKTVSMGLSLVPGWREVIAELDDMPKNEVLGKVMWACLNQIDSWKKQANAAIAKAKQ
jgi:predicted  nucleic acid-binding Zn-ribbon protein